MTGGRPHSLVVIPSLYTDECTDLQPRTGYWADVVESVAVRIPKVQQAHRPNDKPTKRFLGRSPAFWTGDLPRKYLKTITGPPVPKAVIDFG